MATALAPPSRSATRGRVPRRDRARARGRPSWRVHAYPSGLHDCLQCGQESPVGFRFCGVCGAELAQAPPAPAEVRKTVTVVFSDITGSTSLGERLDTEALRSVMSRYFDEMEGVLERHGGTVEKFIGDAVMAVFGIPQLHEDDALRAVRAGVEMRGALHELNDEFERTWGIRILARIGVNTGEVIAGDPTRGESFAVGDAANIAA